MRAAGAATVAAAAALLVGCTYESRLEVPPDAPTDSGPTQDAWQPGGPQSNGPLTLDDSGSGCVRLQFGRDFAWWEHNLEPRTDVEITGFSLVGAKHVRVLGRGVVTPVTSRIGATGFTLGWPPADDVTRTRRFSWADREPAIGAELTAGERSILWVHVRVDPEATSASYEAMDVSYTAGGVELVARSQVSNVFRQRCK